jgi:hypothetical protein
MTANTTKFSEMHFRKKINYNGRNFSMNADMYRLFFALDENKTMAEVADQLQMDSSIITECVIRLWMQEMIEPVEETDLCVNHNFINLMKINLFYILGNKDNAYSHVDSELKNLGCSTNHCLAKFAPALISATALKIPDLNLRQTFQDFMEKILPMRLKLREIVNASAGKVVFNMPGVSRGKTRKLINQIIDERSKGNPIIARTLRIKLMLKGINPDAYLNDTLDNPKTLKQVEQLAITMGVNINEPTQSCYFRSR